MIGLPGAGGAVQVGTGGSAAAWRPPPTPTRPVPSVSPGDTVIHGRYGEGVVMSVSGDGEDAEARVAFSEHGEKNLLLAYAPLKKVG